MARALAVCCSSVLSGRLGVLEVGQALVELGLLVDGLEPQLLDPVLRVDDRLMDRRERLLVVDDLVGELLVLLTDIDVVAHVGKDVGERPARQEGLEERRPTGVVGGPYALGEKRLAPCEFDLLRTLLRLDLEQLRVKTGELHDERVVLRLDDLDPVLHRR